MDWDGFLSRFPGNVAHAFAYGSGVFSQPGLYSSDTPKEEGPMTDIIFVVEDPIQWHRENIAQNGSHYSSIKWLGPSAIDYVAESIGCGVYFNTLIPWSSGRLIKYGVVRASTLERDLIHWDALYLAGRLHKPTTPLLGMGSRSTLAVGLQTALALNLESAVRVALLLLNEESFSMRQLLRVICGISYEGDLRMGLAEDSRKVERIVTGSYRPLVAMYQPVLEKAEKDWKVIQRDGYGDEKNEYFRFDTSPQARGPLLAGLPANVLSKLAAAVGRSAPAQSFSDISARAMLTTSIAGYSGCSDALRKCLTSIVRRSSVRQVLAGFFSAGAVKSARYAWRKFSKYAESDGSTRILSKLGM